MLHYEEGLRLLDRALAIDLSQDNEQNVSYDKETEKKSAITKTKMSRTRQQVIFRIHELRIKANAESHDPPPSYEDSQKNNDNLETTIKIDDDETIVPLPSDAEILYTIAGKVQIFYISAAGKVSAPSYPSTLYIFKFKSTYRVFNQQPSFFEVTYF